MDTLIALYTIGGLVIALIVNAVWYRQYNKMVDEWYKKCEHINVKWHDLCMELIDEGAELMVESIPSADRPKGEWIVNMPNYESICSVCGANETAFIYGTEMWYGLGKSKFCPNCGADMRERMDWRKLMETASL